MRTLYASKYQDGDYEYERIMLHKNFYKVRKLWEASAGAVDAIAEGK